MRVNLNIQVFCAQKMQRVTVAKVICPLLITILYLLISISPLFISDSVFAQSKLHFEKANEYSLQHKGRALLVLKNGKLEYEAYGSGYSADTATDIHSATKSFWCSAVAAMIDDGLVKSFDENIAATIDEWQGERSKSRMTLRQLLDLSSGIKPTNPTTDPLRQANQPDKYIMATKLKVVFEPGSRFFYGPNHYYVLGEFMKRKLRTKNESPLDYLKRRVLEPIGVSIADWERDGSGDPNMPNGAHIKPHDWLKYGQFVLQRGQWKGRQIVSADLISQCLQPSQANAGYGLTFWLNQNGGKGALLEGFPQAPSGYPGGHIYPDAMPDLAMAAGAGKSRMYLVPSMNMVIVRQAEGEKLAGYQDYHFLGLLFSGEPGTKTIRQKVRLQGMGRNPGTVEDQPSGKSYAGLSGGQALGRIARLDRNGDGRISRKEVPEQAKRLKQNFDRIDSNMDGFISPDEVARIPSLAGGAGTGKPVTRDDHVASDKQNRNKKLQQSNSAEGENFSDIDDVLTQMISNYGLDGAGLVVERQGATLYEKSFGSFTPDTAVPIASATKWLTVAAVLSAVDRGALNLDDPVSRYLPGFTGEKKNITIRQCLATTAGFSDRIPAIWNSKITLREAVDDIASTTLKSKPGEAFLYGGAGFHIAGYAAMIAMGKDNWHALFAELITEPLGMSDTIYGMIQGRSKGLKLNLEPEPGSNPWLGGGAISTLNDYRKFVRMLANNGVFNGKRILSESSIDEMFKIQTNDLAIRKTLHPVKDTPYGLGGWIEKADSKGSGTKVRDMGVWGWNPWIDFERGYFAIIGVHDDMNRLWRSFKNIESIIENSIEQSEKQLNNTSAIELRKLRWENLDRTYLIHVPEKIKSKRAMPLVIMLHAGKSDAGEWINRTKWLSKSDQEKFIVAAPNAIAIRSGNGRSITAWNDGSGRNSKTDDTGFINAMIKEIAAQYPVDEARIYLTGVGNGASMAYRSGVELSEKIAAIAPVSGHLWKHPDRLDSKVSLIALIGTEDPINPIKPGARREMTGQPGRYKPQIRDSVLAWVEALGLGSKPKLLAPARAVTGEGYGPTADGSKVEFYSIEGMGHGWPGDVESLTFSGVTKHDDPPLDATDMIWSFFRDHPKKQ